MRYDEGAVPEGRIWSRGRLPATAPLFRTHTRNRLAVAEEQNARIAVSIPFLRRMTVRRSAAATQGGKDHARTAFAWLRHPWKCVGILQSWRLNKQTRFNSGVTQSSPLSSNPATNCWRETTDGNIELLELYDGHIHWKAYTPHGVETPFFSGNERRGTSEIHSIATW